MAVLNLGIVAHVDAGKTTLTERLLFEAGVISQVGRVDHADTTTDADALERRRGITIRSAVVAFTVPGPHGEPVKVNLIDTPGHSDFIAEVERAVAVLDGAVLVVSAVEGIQAQTRMLIRVLERLRIPFLIFANKIDRVGAAYEQTMTALREALRGDAVALTNPLGLGTRAAQVADRSGPGLLAELVERCGEYDAELLSRYVEHGSVSLAAALRSLAALAAAGQMHPVLFGSALRGIGVPEVLAAIGGYLPADGGRQDRPLHATVFKIERDPAGHKLAYARLSSGSLTAREHIAVHHRRRSGAIEMTKARPSRVAVFDQGAGTSAGTARAGDIARVSGLDQVVIGDQLGSWDSSRVDRFFAPPGLEAVVLPRDPDRRGALFDALRQLSEQDPLIDARLDGLDDEITVSLYGEVQKEVLASRLETEYGLLADFLPTRTVHVERVAGVAEGFDRTASGNASVGLRVQAGPAGSQLTYRLGEGVERGYLLPSFHVAIEETVASEVARGVYGWRVIDCAVTLVHGRFHAATPSAGEFRRLTASSFRTALSAAGTTVCAPVSRFELELPADALPALLSRVTVLGGTPDPPELNGPRARLTGRIATGSVRDLEERVPALTSGLGVFLAEPDGYRPVRGRPPSRYDRATRTQVPH